MAAWLPEAVAGEGAVDIASMTASDPRGCPSPSPTPAISVALLAAPTMWLAFASYLHAGPFVYVRPHWPEGTRATNRGSDVIDASDLLGAPQIAGVEVSPVGFFRASEARAAHSTTRAFVPGTIRPTIGERLGIKRAAEERRRDAAASKSTPNYGNWGYLAVTDTELALTTTEPGKGGVGRRLGQLITTVPRSTVAQVELAGDWRHPTFYILSSAPLRLTFTDGTAWAFEVKRFSRGRAKRLVRTLQSR
jgi:hypothetical protein